MLIILDLDETLVYSTRKPLPREHDFTVGEYFTYCRPGVSDFLHYLAGRYPLAVWTSSGSRYAQEVVSRVFPESVHLEFVWSRDRCTRRFDPETREELWIKDLKKVKRLGFRLEEILMVDDSPEKVARNYGNHICVIPFRGDPNDSELPLLARYISTLEGTPNVRTLEKRGWRSSVSNDQLDTPAQR